MGKHTERKNDYDFDDDTAQVMINDLALDKDSFYEQFQSNKSRINSKRARDARRRIEEYQENRKLAERLSEYYD